MVDECAEIFAAVPVDSEVHAGVWAPFLRVDAPHRNAQSVYFRSRRGVLKDMSMKKRQSFLCLISSRRCHKAA